MLFRNNRCKFDGNYFIIKYNDNDEYRYIMRLIRGFSYIYTYKIKNYDTRAKKYRERVYELFKVNTFSKSILFYRGIAKPMILALMKDTYELKKSGFLNGSIEKTIESNNGFKINNCNFKKLNYSPPNFLYDYQKFAFDKSISDLSLVGASTIQMATGGGKTEVAIALAQSFKPPVFFVSLSKFLIHQFVERYNKYKTPNMPDVGEVTGESKELKPVTGVTIQTLYNSIIEVTKDNSLIESYAIDKNLSEEYISENPDELPFEFKKLLVNKFKNANLVIMDEVQHLPALTVKSTLMHSPNSFRVGLSATPWRDDGLTNVIYAVTGLPSVKISFSQLVYLKRLVPAKITFELYKPPYSSKTYSLRGARGFNEVSKMLTDDAYRYCQITKLIREILRLKRYPLLVLVRYINQGKILSQWLKNNGIPNEFIYSIHSIQERDYVLKSLTNPDNPIKVVIATTIADEGLDIPDLRSLLILSGGKSSVKTYQRVGRVVRIEKHNPYGLPPKKYGYVYDWVDLVNYYSNHSRIREEAYNKEASWKVYKELVNFPDCEKYRGKSAIKIISDYIDIDLSSKRRRTIPDNYEEFVFK